MITEGKKEYFSIIRMNLEKIISNEKKTKEKVPTYFSIYIEFWEMYPNM